ncbi:hypothetical protein Amet_4343 [Alkaliphilus metalliredigens QYMF]|uniref:Uncharacterized protein n=1 Tax=Alkaliphilus metalliredigens (strain QYMF) TaxID=293826 RepID=A6TKE8_ALKMQ|nr:hypothetical protein [Alkaliphilus metalliredigens]ABR46666.1 hypothetical protein Amet_0438 [Alkaliphilus metalliredigens QYMF]ABR48138.1 hypothetical protein Amet_1975 [Alkaliphilus metalliredigens QYMF]ABR50417.1 hypothetical protein Amet_4343 [Alkaliphilus metalliredigens QYMF]
MFNEQLPEWLNEGTEPPAQKKSDGWLPTEKPPAGWFNWLFNKIYKCIKEIRQKVMNLDEDLGSHVAESVSEVIDFQRDASILGTQHIATPRKPKGITLYANITGQATISIGFFGQIGAQKSFYSGSGSGIWRPYTGSAILISQGDTTNRLSGNIRNVENDGFDILWSQVSGANTGTITITAMVVYHGEG